jgi:hypothetical protein
MELLERSASAPRGFPMRGGCRRFGAGSGWRSRAGAAATNAVAGAGMDRPKLLARSAKSVPFTLPSPFRSPPV